MLYVSVCVDCVTLLNMIVVDVCVLFACDIVVGIVWVCRCWPCLLFVVVVVCVRRCCGWWWLCLLLVAVVCVLSLLLLYCS